MAAGGMEHQPYLSLLCTALHVAQGSEAELLEGSTLPGVQWPEHQHQGLGLPRPEAPVRVAELSKAKAVRSPGSVDCRPRGV